MLTVTVKKDNSFGNIKDEYPLDFTLVHRYDGTLEDIKTIFKQIAIGLTFTEDTIKDIFNEEY